MTKTLMKVALLATCLIISLAGVGLLLYGSPQAAVARLRGLPLVVDTPVKSLGVLDAGKKGEAEFEFQNLAGHRIDLFGSRTSCDCVATHGLPVVLEPYGRKRISFEVASERTGGSYVVSAKVFTSEPTQSEVVLSIVFTVE